ARLGHLHCQCCGRRVQRDSAQSIQQQLATLAGAEDPRLIITFPIVIPANFTEDEVRGFLEQQGYTRVHHEETRLHAAPASSGKGKAKRAPKAEKLRVLHVVQDRFRFSSAEPQRVMEALDTALKQGGGHLAVYAMPESGDEQAQETAWRFSNRLHCAHCDIEYSTPLPSTFSFNSPLGACEACRGFGRVMGIDYGLVVPDRS